MAGQGRGDADRHRAYQRGFAGRAYQASQSRRRIVIHPRPPKSRAMRPGGSYRPAASVPRARAFAAAPPTAEVESAAAGSGGAIAHPLRQGDGGGGMAPGGRGGDRAIRYRRQRPLRPFESSRALPRASSSRRRSSRQGRAASRRGPSGGGDGQAITLRSGQTAVTAARAGGLRERPAAEHRFWLALLGDGSGLLARRGFLDQQRAGTALTANLLSMIRTSTPRRARRSGRVLERPDVLAPVPRHATWRLDAPGLGCLFLAVHHRRRAQGRRRPRRSRRPSPGSRHVAPRIEPLAEHVQLVAHVAGLARVEGRPSALRSTCCTPPPRSRGRRARAHPRGSRPGRSSGLGRAPARPRPPSPRARCLAARGAPHPGERSGRSGRGPRGSGQPAASPPAPGTDPGTPPPCPPDAKPECPSHSS